MKLFNRVRNRPQGFPLLLSFIICGLLGCGEESASPVLPAFPLVVSGNQRFLQDQTGVPFPILGRTAWFITSLTDAEVTTFIDDTVAKGYNAIGVSRREPRPAR